MPNPPSFIRVLVTEDHKCRICEANLLVGEAKVVTNNQIQEHLKRAMTSHTEHSGAIELAGWIQDLANHPPTKDLSTRMKKLSSVSDAEFHESWPGLISRSISLQSRREQIRVSAFTSGES